MNLTLAKRVNKIKPSFTLQMATIAADMISQGRDVINFSVGEPDFNTPEHIINAGKKAMDDGFTKYTSGAGMLEFREAICEKLRRENKIIYTPSDVLVSNGEKQSLSIACQAMFDKGDRVIVFKPYWVSFPEFIRLADAEPVLIDTLSKQNFEPDFKDLEKNIHPKVKGVIINSPSNPTGGVWSNESIIKLLKIAKKENWYVISDECYERLVYNKVFTSIEKLNRDNKINASVITCMSLSKTYAMTGWRIGYSFGPSKIIKAMAKIQGQATSCANSIGQKAGIEALIGDQKCVDDMKYRFLKRRNLIIRLFKEIKNIDCIVPDGAFYIFPNFKNFLNRRVNGNILKDTFDISQYILESVNVVTVPGDGFGAPGHIRFSYATNSKIIRRGLERVKKALENIN